MKTKGGRTSPTKIKPKSNETHALETIIQKSLDWIRGSVPISLGKNYPPAKPDKLCIFAEAHSSPCSFCVSSRKRLIELPPAVTNSDEVRNSLKLKIMNRLPNCSGELLALRKVATLNLFALKCGSLSSPRTGLFNSLGSLKLG